MHKDTSSSGRKWHRKPLRVSGSSTDLKIYIDRIEDDGMGQTVCVRSYSATLVDANVLLVVRYRQLHVVETSSATGSKHRFMSFYNRDSTGVGEMIDL